MANTIPLPPPVGSFLEIEKKNPHCQASYTLTFCCSHVRTDCRLSAMARNLAPYRSAGQPERRVWGDAEQGEVAAWRDPPVGAERSLQGARARLPRHSQSTGSTNFKHLRSKLSDPAPGVDQLDAVGGSPAGAVALPSAVGLLDACRHRRAFPWDASGTISRRGYRLRSLSVENKVILRASKPIVLEEVDCRHEQVRDKLPAVPHLQQVESSTPCVGSPSPTERLRSAEPRSEECHCNALPASASPSCTRVARVFDARHLTQLTVIVSTPRVEGVWTLPLQDAGLSSTCSFSHQLPDQPLAHVTSKFAYSRVNR